MTPARRTDEESRPTRRSDEESRRIIRERLDDTLVVEAAAGTGKTTELVNRIVRVLADGRANVREIVAVTFTEKAAGELKLRLREQLETERQQAISRDVQTRLNDAVQNLEEAHVSTIHGFCADLLRERPVEARVDPLFRVLTEGQAERLFNEAFTGWFQLQLEHPPEGVRRSLRRTSRGARPGDADEDGPMERLRRAAFNLAEWRDFRGAWTREPFDREGMITAIVPLVHTLADVSRNPSYAGDNLYLDTEPVRRLSVDLSSAPPPETAADFDGLDSQLVDLRRNRDFKRGRKGSGPTYAKGAPRARVLEARDLLVHALDEFQLRADADLAALLHDELLECVDRYQRLKAREGALDFLDLLLHARDLIRGNTAVRNHFQARFRCLFVDEFQDTDPLQAELLLLLASKDAGETRWQHVDPVPGKLFLVGDPKQSIYRFRRADVHIYRQVCDLLVARGAVAVELRKSFRGVRNLQRVINAAFAQVMDGNVETRQASYVRLEPSRADDPQQPSVVVLPVPKPYAQRFIAARAIEESLPDAVGAYVDWLVNHSNWMVTERRDSSKRVRLESRHICILFRRFVSYGEDITRDYVDALEARGIKHLLVGGRAFHGREEIETLRAALMAVEWPDDQLSVFATLRGALFALGDEELLEYHHHAGSFHPFRIPATRARDLLVVPAVGDGPYAEGWVAPLNAAIYPAEDARRVQARGTGCPPFTSKDSVLSRPDGDPASRLTVCPGQHDFTSPDEPYSVVWWSPEPAVLSLGAQAPFGLRRDDLIVKDVAPAVLRRGLDAYQTWKSGREAAIAAAQQPSIDVMTATAAAASELVASIGDEIEVATEMVAGSAGFGEATAPNRPGGQRFGSLVHALIADLPLDKTDAPTIARLASVHGRVLGADAAEIAAAEDLVRRVRQHPVLQAAARAARDGQCYREMPVTWRADSGALIEGFVDLVFRDEAGFVVVDFKTDRELDEAADRYQRQVRIYAAAVAAATGLSTRAVLMRM